MIPANESCGFPGLRHDDDEYDDYDETLKTKRETRENWKREDYRLENLSNGTTSCLVCKKVFASQISAKKHFRNMHGPEPAMLIKCTLCEKCFKLRDYFRDHMNNCHQISGVRNIVESYGVYVENHVPH